MGKFLWENTGKFFRVSAGYEIARALGPEKAYRHTKALPMFDAMTGCDTVSCFFGHGQKAAWTVWTALPELTRHSLFSPLHRIILMKMPYTLTLSRQNKHRN